MLYICADDYGMSSVADAQILRSVREGAVRKISVFANHPPDALPDLPEVTWSVHLNLSEGRALCEEKNVLTTPQGNFKYDFVGLLRLSLSGKRKAMETALYAELSAQIARVRTLLTPDTPLWIDAHQHVHMIPLIFRVLLRVIEENNIPVRYLRFPAEPLLPYLRTPSLYLTYAPAGLVKQWLLKFLGMLNYKALLQSKIPSAYFMGVLFSGKMDTARVEKILPHYLRHAARKGADIEVLLHPGGCEKADIPWESSARSFGKFYTATGRKEELQTAIQLNNIEKEGF